MSKRKRSAGLSGDEAKAAIAKAAADAAEEAAAEAAEEARETARFEAAEAAEAAAVAESKEYEDAGASLQLMSTAELNRANTRMKCPYLDTINKQLVDFDSEKLCSVTLSNMNVYACLVCGKFFSGRGKSTAAYTHSVSCGHFVFMNLQSARTYCLPDSYEVLDSSLDLIVKCLIPRYTMEDRLHLNNNSSLARDVYGISYLPGFIGLNNLNSTDYVNVVLHALAHITPFRDFWLELEHYKYSKSNLVHHFGSVMRKMWSSSNFKSTGY
jgi:U4/U6.U5 tri-snRNP-associated protein 2